MNKNYTSPLGICNTRNNGRHGTAPTCTDCDGQYKRVESMLNEGVVQLPHALRWEGASIYTHKYVLIQDIM